MLQTSSLMLATRVIAGCALLIAGAVLALPGIPGPGLVVILVGLWLLGDHFAWAKRALAWITEKTGVNREWSITCSKESAKTQGNRYEHPAHRPHSDDP